MKKLTKVGIIAAMFASITLLSACSSKDKMAEEDTEQALVEQTQDLMDEDLMVDDESGEMETSDFSDFSDDSLMEDSEDAAETSALEETAIEEPSYNEGYDNAETSSGLDSDDTETASADLGATSSGLGH